MDTQAEIKALKATLKLVKPAVSKHLVATQHVVIDAGADALEITANNLQTSIRASVPCIVGASGRCAVEFAALERALKPHKSGRISLVEKGAILCVGGIPIDTLPVAEMPVVDTLPEVATHVIANGFWAALRMCAPAMANEKEDRTYLQGVHIDAKRKRLVSTDGHRLHMSHCPSIPPVQGGAELILDAESVKALLIADKAGALINCEFGLGIGRYVVSGAGYQLVGKLADGAFPPYEKVLPPDLETFQISIAIDSFLQALEITNAFPTYNESWPAGTLCFSGNEATWTPHSLNEVGPIPLDVAGANGAEEEDRKASFNACYIQAILKEAKAQKQKRIEMRLHAVGGDEYALLLRAENSTFIVMPARL